MPIMNKGRIEAFSDAIFAVAMTLLVIDIKIPDLVGPVTNAQVLQIVSEVTPLIALYMASFFVLAVLWTNHHFIFHAFAKEVNRQLNLLNMLYLMFVVLVPFSVQLFTAYSEATAAVVFYGVNLFVIVFLSTVMTQYVRRNKDLLHPGLSQRTMNQAQFRARLSLLFYPLGIVCAFFWIPASFFFYTFPIVFNIIPGTLNFLERHSPLNFD